MAATSHGNYYPYSMEQYRESFDILQETLEEQEIPLKLYPGMEIFVNDRAIKLLKSRRLLTMNNTDYVLIEFDLGYKVLTLSPIQYTELLLPVPVKKTSPNLYFSPP